MTKSIIIKTDKLVKTYEEKKDGIAAPLIDETKIWSAFTNRLQEIHEYYGKHPSGPLVQADYEQLVFDVDYGAPIEEAKAEKLCIYLMRQSKGQKKWEKTTRWSRQWVTNGTTSG